MKCAPVPVLLLAALALGQSWVVEQVDSTASSQVELAKAADGRLWACYSTASGRVRVACFADSVWNITDVCSAYVTGRSFLAAGPRGELCLTCYRSDSSWLYQLIGDTWHGEIYPFMSQSIFGTVAYDTAGRLSTAFAESAYSFWVGQDTDSGWVAEMAGDLPVSGTSHGNITAFTVAKNGSPWYFAHAWWTTPRDWGDKCVLLHLSDGSWIRTLYHQGQGSAIPLALVPHGDGVGYVVQNYGILLCNGEHITDVGGHVVAGLAYTSEDIPLLALVPANSPYWLRFAYRTAIWHVENISGPAGAGGVDIEVDNSDQVVIVYNTRDSGLWCARGMVADVVGIENSLSPQLPSRQLEPTVDRILPRGAVIFDAMGRRVMNPRSGIFFVRDEGRGVGDKGRMRKVILQR